MPWRMLTIAVAGLLVAADAPEDKTKQALEDLQGTWLLTAREANGQEAKVPSQLIGDIRLTIHGSRVVTFTGAAKVDGSIHLFAKSNRVEFLERTGNSFQALYEVNGDELRLCTTPTGECPESFGSKSDNAFVMVYRREKPDDPDVAPAKAELKKLQGAWRMKLKKDADEGTQRDLIWTFDGYELAVQIDGQPMPDKATVVINPKMQPPCLGVLFPGGSLLGTYSLDDDVLTISTAQPGGPQKMMVLKRVAP